MSAPDLEANPANPPDPQSTLADARPGSRGLIVLYWAAISGAALNVLRGFHWNPGTGTLFVDPYWVGFYLRSYGESFRRRALIGSLCRFLFPAGVPVVLINLTGVLVLTACLVLLFRALCRLAGESSPVSSAEALPARRTLLVFALAASSMTAVFYETTGDLLHIAMLLFCVAGLCTTRFVRSEMVRLLLLAAVAVVGFFIHEASLFFLVPALPFFFKARPRLRDFVLPGLLYVALLALSNHWSTEFSPHATFHANLWHHAPQSVNPDSTPTFMNELHFERYLYFHSTDAKLYFLNRCLRALVLAFAYLIALAVALPRRTLPRTLLAFSFILVCSVPLWIVAVDWGRFLTYMFLLAVVSSGLWQDDPDPTAFAVPNFVQRASDRLQALANVELLQLGVVFVLLCSSEFPAVHVDSMTIVDAQTFLIVAALAALAWVTQRRERSGASAEFGR